MLGEKRSTYRYLIWRYLLEILSILCEILFDPAVQDVQLSISYKIISLISQLTKYLLLKKEIPGYYYFLLYQRRTNKMRIKISFRSRVVIKSEGIKFLS